MPRIRWLLNLIFLTAIAIPLLVASGRLAHGQGITTGSITGTVTDPQAAVVPGATVTATATATGVVLTTVSQANGDFAFRDLPPGSYDVHIAAAGFQAIDAKGVIVVSGGSTSLKNQQLSIGASTTVEVQTENPAQLDTTQSQILTTFSSQQLEDLPLGNGLDEVTFLIPGVARAGAATFSNTNASTGTSVNGQRGRSNNFEIDGQSNNDNSIGGPQIFFGNQDALQEIQVVTNDFSAEYGRNMGSVVNYITKNGTNTFHGTAFEMYTGSFLESFSNQEKSPVFGFCAGGQTPAANSCIAPSLPRLTANNFGGTLGGPIWRNKVWFFGSAYWQRVYTGVIPSSSGGLLTPTPAGIAQLQADYPGSSAVAILSKYGPFGIPVGNPIVVPGSTQQENVTLPNGSVTQVQVGQFERSVASPFTDQEQLGRMDFQPTQNDHLFGRYFHQSELTVAAPFTPISTGYFVNVPAISDSIGADWTHTFSPRMIDQLRYSYQESKVYFQGGSDPNCVSTNFPECASDLIFIGGTPDASFGLSGAFPEGRTVKVTQVQNNATLTKGNSTILFGGEYDYQNSPNTFLPNYNGAFLYSDLSAFLNDPKGTGLLDLTNGSPNIPFTEGDFALYLQDDWRVESNLTLNLGLRYEYFGQAVNELNKISVAQQTGPNPFWNTSLPLSATTFPKVDRQWKNIEPRIGFDWNPSAYGGRFVVRGGYAINYDPVFYNPFLNSYDAAPVTNNAVFGCNGPCLPAGGAFTGAAVRAANLRFLPTGSDPRTQNLSTFPTNFRNPRAQTYYLGFQYQVSKAAVFSTEYVGVHGTQNFQQTDGNPFLLPVAQAFPNVVSPSSLCQNPAATGYGRLNCNYANVSTLTNGAWLIYNGLQSSLTTQDLHGLTATIAYTYSQALDNASEIYATGSAGVANEYPQNPLNPNLGERGQSATSYPNVASVSLTYNIPGILQGSRWMGRLFGGYSLNTIWLYNSGQPYNPLQPLTLPSGDTSYCDGVFNTSFPGADTCRMILSNPRAPLNTVAYLTVDPANPNVGPSYYVYGTTGQTSASGAPIPGTPISPSDAHWIVNNQLEANAIGNPYGGSGRNILRGQPYDNVDASIFKTTKIRENLSLQLQLNVYNALNHDFLGTPNINLSAFNAANPINPFLSLAYNTTGIPNLSNVSGNRLVQIGGKIVF